MYRRLFVIAAIGVASAAALYPYYRSCRNAQLELEIRDCDYRLGLLKESESAYLRCIAGHAKDQCPLCGTDREGAIASLRKQEAAALAHKRDLAGRKGSWWH